MSEQSLREVIYNALYVGKIPEWELHAKTTTAITEDVQKWLDERDCDAHKHGRDEAQEPWKDALDAINADPGSVTVSKLGEAEAAPTPDSTQDQFKSIRDRLNLMWDSIDTLSAVVISMEEISLRDRFAMAALTGCIANKHCEPETTYEVIASRAFAMADCMMAARQQEQEGVAL